MLIYSAYHADRTPLFVYKTHFNLAFWMIIYSAYHADRTPLFFYYNPLYLSILDDNLQCWLHATELEVKCI